jgi:Short C-terminal domain
MRRVRGGPACATVAAVVLLSGMMRSAAVTGRTDTLAAWCAGRQGGRWAERTVRAAFPTAAPRADPAEALRELNELHRRGIVTDAEFAALRARYGG